MSKVILISCETLFDNVSKSPLDNIDFVEFFDSTVDALKRAIEVIDFNFEENITDKYDGNDKKCDKIEKKYKNLVNENRLIEAIYFYNHEIACIDYISLYVHKATADKASHCDRIDQKTLFDVIFP